MALRNGGNNELEQKHGCSSQKTLQTEQSPRSKHKGQRIVTVSNYTSYNKTLGAVINK